VLHSIYVLTPALKDSRSFIIFTFCEYSYKIISILISDFGKFLLRTGTLTVANEVR